MIHLIVGWYLVIVKVMIQFILKSMIYYGYNKNSRH